MAYDLNLYYFLKRNLRICYKTTTGDETYIRCPYCGDSKKDLNKARLYIHNKPPFKYHCFNCETSGIVNDKFLDLIVKNESTYEISQYLKEKRIEVKGSENIVNNKVLNHKYFKKTLDFSISNKKDLKKLEYLNNRLGTNIAEQDLSTYKIVLNLQDFFNKNNLDIRKRFISQNEQRTFFNLRNNYIGFLSSDRNTIIFRNTNPNCKKNERFMNLRVFLTEEYETKKNYNISATIDKYKEKYNIVIAEGPIDIISIYNHFYKDKVNLNDYIFLANGGKSYTTSLKFISDLTLLDNNIIIYSDTDVKIDFYKNLKNYSPELKNSNITIYYNTIGKDFGVPINEIKLSNKINI